jgi:hypothetical protein
MRGTLGARYVRHLPGYDDSALSSDMGRPQPGTPMRPRGACRCGLRVCHRLMVGPSDRRGLPQGTAASQLRQRICRVIVFRAARGLADRLAHRRAVWCGHLAGAHALVARRTAWGHLSGSACRFGCVPVPDQS